MARTEKLLGVSLASSLMTTPRRTAIQCRHVTVVNLPAGAGRQVALSFDDSAEFIPVGVGDRFTACDAGAFGAVTVRAPALGGELLLLLSNDDLVPVPAGGAAEPETRLARFLDVFWPPFGSAADGGALPQKWGWQQGGVQGQAATVDNFWTLSNGGAGLLPCAARRLGRMVGLLRPGGAGYSEARFNLTDINWQRLAAGARSVRDSRAQSWHIEWSMARDGAGGAKDFGHGLYLQGSDGTAPGSPSSNNEFLGIVGDGAGGWIAATRTAPGAALAWSAPLALPGLVTESARFRIALLDANPATGENGRLRFYVNDTLAAELTDMALVPAVSAPKAAGCAYAVALRDEGADAQRLWFHDVGVWTSKGEGTAQP